MTIVGFPAKPELQKRLEDVATGWPIHASDGLGKPYGDINGSTANPPSPAAVILAEGIGLLEGERARQHGDKLALHKTMAGLFSAYLGIDVKPSEAAMLAALMKIARTKHGALNPDDYRDASPYIGISWECADAGC
jgi:hypothetical protein